MEIDLLNYGTMIYNIRRANKMTQTELAQKADVGNKAVISSIESGNRNITLSTLIKILNVLGYELKFKEKSTLNKAV